MNDVSCLVEVWTKIDGSELRRIVEEWAKR